MPKLIWVKPGRNDGRVALFEQNSAHPGGEVFVAGPPVQVALTPLVERKLGSGELVETDAPVAVQESEQKPVDHKTKAEVQEMIERAKVGANPEPEPKVKAEEPEPFQPLSKGGRPEFDVKRKPGRPRKTKE